MIFRLTLLRMVILATYPCIQANASDSAMIIWLPYSHTASAITGSIETSNDLITIQDRDYPVILAKKFKDEQLPDIGKLVAVKEPYAARLYQILIPASDKFKNDNTMCGDKDTRWVLMVREEEMGAGLTLAFFSGNHEPVLDNGDDDNEMCGTFSYYRYGQK